MKIQFVKHHKTLSWLQIPKKCMLHREVIAVTSERERGRVVSTVSRLHAATASVGELELTHASGSSRQLDIYQMLCVQF